MQDQAHAGTHLLKSEIVRGMEGLFFFFRPQALTLASDFFFLVLFEICVNACAKVCAWFASFFFSLQLFEVNIVGYVCAV